jgi:hypothetical protein
MSDERHKEHTEPQPRDFTAAGNDHAAVRASFLRMERFPVRCECGEDDCTERFLISRKDFAQLRSRSEPVTVVGHGLNGPRMP